MQTGRERFAGFVKAMDEGGVAIDQALLKDGDFSRESGESAMRELQGAIEPLGEPLLNTATNVAGVVKAFGEWFAGIGEGGQMAVLAIAGILASIGPVLSIAGNLVAVIPAITAALSGAGGAAGLFGGALAALTGPVGIVLGVLAGLTAAIVYLWSTNEGFRTAVTEAWNAIWGTIQAVIAQLQPYVEQAWAAISNAVTQAMNVIMPIVSAGFQFIIAVAVPILQQLLQNVGNTFQVILQTITGVMNGIAQIIQGAWSLIQGIFQTVLGLINGIVTGDFSQMEAGIQGIMSGITGIISGAWNVVVSVVGGAINGVVSTVQNGLNTALSVVQGIFSGIESAVSNAMNGAKNVVSGVISAIKGFFNFRISWPHIPLPHIHYDLINVPLLGNIPNPATLSISWYAKGSVFNGPSVIGVGESGPEGVVPFNKRGAAPLAEGIMEQLERMGGIGRGGDTNVTINVYATVREEADIKKLSREIAKEIKRAEMRQGAFA